MTHEKKKQIFAYIDTKTKLQISCVVTAQLISTFVFATWLVQFFLYLYPNFQDSSFHLLVSRPVCVRPGAETLKTGFLTSQLII